jgi:hypothetical protein
VNGQFVRKGRPLELIEGDVVQVGPRILRVRAVTARIRAEGGGEPAGSVRTFTVGTDGGAEHALRVLIDVVRGIPADGTAEAAGRMVLEKLLSVTKLERALLVRFDPMRTDADILAAAGPEGRPVSRTVLASASDPQRVAHLSQSTVDFQSAASIIGTGVREVLCARVVVEGDDQLYLYLDSAGLRAPVDAAMAELVGAAARVCGLVRRLLVEPAFAAGHAACGRLRGRGAAPRWIGARVGRRRLGQGRCGCDADGIDAGVDVRGGHARRGA